MIDWTKLCRNRIISLYGLSTETERFIRQNETWMNIAGLLDGFHTYGEMYGYSIITLEEAVAKGVDLIIVVARPGSCKTITKKIGVYCHDNNIDLIDIRGNNLLNVPTVNYTYNNSSCGTRQELKDKINAADVISFDLFDTLIMRKIRSYTDIFELLDYRLREEGIYIPDFAKHRLFAEKELSKKGSPLLEDIYELVLKRIGGSFIGAHELSELERKLDISLFSVRYVMRDIFKMAISAGKTVVITTDSYYSEKQVADFLKQFDIYGYSKLFVSCEFGFSKQHGLLRVLAEEYKGKSILHIGDDELSDIENAKKNGLDTFRIYSAIDFFDALGYLGTEEYIENIADVVKIGLFISNIFNDPFWFEAHDRRLFIEDVYDIGYLFCAPLITDFILWMNECVNNQGLKQIIFVSRDGFLIGNLFRIINSKIKTFYFLSSRIAAIRAGMESKEDIDYIYGMKYFGTPEDELKVRFGIEIDNIKSIDRNTEILNKSLKQKEYYHKYIDKLDLCDSDIGMFDFVAKGTTQMYLQKLFSQHIKGFYFMQLEPEFMSDKGLEIEPFYSDNEKDLSAFFDNYYIFETIITSPYPQVEEMNIDGNPVFSKETRSEKDLRTISKAQKGIKNYFLDYLDILPEFLRHNNKKLDEKLLILLNKVQIHDNDFISLKVEDIFFGRMTEIEDVIG